MWEQYKETFDGVHASQRLKTEVLNMKREETVTKRRRVPAAALAAAILAVALAGTAIAYVSRVVVEPYEDGYSVQVEAGSIPLSSLSEDILQRAASATDITEILPFQSWDAAEEYLGLEIANNARLAQMEKGLYSISLSKNKSEVAHCLILLDYCEALPSCIELTASYKEKNFTIIEKAVLMVDNPALEENNSYWYGKPSSEMTDTEWYVTAGGIEAAIVTSLPASGTGMKYEANFILNQTFLCVRISVDEGESNEDALTLLKEILDAYE